MIDSVREFLVDVEQFTTQNPKELEDFRIKYLGKKGILNDLFAKFKEVPNEQKKEFGQVINLLKNQVNDKIEILKSSFETSDIQSSTIDLTRSGIIKI
jgi:phenylalanyl-tRNA synthetase alpha chain